MTLLQDIVWRSCLPWLLCVSFKNKLFFFFLGLFNILCVQ